MKLLEKILVPVDILTDSEAQINAALKLANSYKSEIILMYVVPDNDLNKEIKDLIIKSVSVHLDVIKNIFINNDIKVQEPVITFGNIVETIVKKANLEKVNLVLIGTRNKKAEENFKLGIISENIIRESDVPVGLINTTSTTLFTRILCPVDFSEPSKRALYNAGLLARKYSSTLHILSVYEPLEYVSLRLNIDLDEENATRLKRVYNELDSITEEYDLNGINHISEVKTGIVEEEILKTIKEQAIDLLIMGTSGRTGLSRFFMGSVTEKVIREMPCSFITVKKKDIIQ